MKIFNFVVQQDMQYYSVGDFLYILFTSLFDNVLLL